MTLSFKGAPQARSTERCSPKLSISLSKSGLQDSASSATIQNSLPTCMRVCPSLVSSAICSRLQDKKYEISKSRDISESNKLHDWSDNIPRISWCYKIDHWKLPVLTRWLCGGGRSGCWCRCWHHLRQDVHELAQIVMVLLAYRQRIIFV